MAGKTTAFLGNVPDRAIHEIKAFEARAIGTEEKGFYGVPRASLANRVINNYGKHSTGVQAGIIILHLRTIGGGERVSVVTNNSGRAYYYYYNYYECAPARAREHALLDHRWERRGAATVGATVGVLRRWRSGAALRRYGKLRGASAVGNSRGARRLCRRPHQRFRAWQV